MRRLRYSERATLQSMTDLNVNQSLRPVIVRFKFNEVSFDYERTFNFQQATNSIIHITPTKKYSDTVNHQYIVDSKYKKARLLGTSIVINDLYFDGLSSNHRLYMKADPYVYDKEGHRGRIYYRSNSDWRSWST